MKQFAKQKRHFLSKILMMCLTLVSSRGFSHDFWLEAHPFYTNANNSVDISVHVGNEFIGDSLPNIPNWYTDFSLYQQHSKIEIKGELGRDPAGHFTPEQTGTYAIGYQTDFSYVEIDPDTFIEYLTDEGLDNAIQYRQENKLTQTTGKENYVRHAKTLVQSGDQFSIDNSNINLGYELEIIPLTNPYKKKLSDTLNFKILYQNKPVKNILLSAYSKVRPEKIQSVRSDKNGEATITLDQLGPWLIKAVKILKIDEDKAQWQSHWASLTFEIIQH